MPVIIEGEQKQFKALSPFSKEVKEKRLNFVVDTLVDIAGGKQRYVSYGAILADAGYSKAVIKTPAKVLQSKSFQELLEEKMPDSLLLETHHGLLKHTKLEHMVFPMGSIGEDDINLSGATPNAPSVIEKAGVPIERTTLTDEEIKQMLAEVNCTVRRIVHGDTARHVYYWVQDAKARADALKLVYDLKGLLEKNKQPAGGNTYNTQVNIQDGTPRGQQMVEQFTQFMLQQTLPQNRPNSATGN